MKRFKYRLTELGNERCRKGLFYGSSWAHYRGITKNIFDILFKNDNPMTFGEIYEKMDIEADRSTVSAILYTNTKAGYLERSR